MSATSPNPLPLSQSQPELRIRTPQLKREIVSAGDFYLPAHFESSHPNQTVVSPVRLTSPHTPAARAMLTAHQQLKEELGLDHFDDKAYTVMRS